MKIKHKIKLTDLHLNDGSHGLPKNPRFVRDDRFKKLCESIRDFPEAMPARGIVVDERSVILGGNMRYRACQANGMKEIPASWVHRLVGLTVEQKRRFIIMDNRAFGDDDMDLLANEWDMDELIAAGWTDDDLTGPINRPEGEAAGSSPWDRVGDACEGVMFSFGTVQRRLPVELFEAFSQAVGSDNLEVWLREAIRH
jgi:hypothetical protein